MDFVTICGRMLALLSHRAGALGSPTLHAGLPYPPFSVLYGALAYQYHERACFRLVPLRVYISQHLARTVGRSHAPKGYLQTTDRDSGCAPPHALEPLRQSASRPLGIAHHRAALAVVHVDILVLHRWQHHEIMLQSTAPDSAPCCLKAAGEMQGLDARTWHGSISVR